MNRLAFLETRRRDENAGVVIGFQLTDLRLQISHLRSSSRISNPGDLKSDMRILNSRIRRPSLASRIAAREDRAEALLVFSRSNERANHRVLNIHVADREAIYLAQPELKSTNVGVAAQVAGVFREHKRAVVFPID